MTTYFSQLGYDCPKFSNPADYVMELINDDFENHADVKKLKDNFLDLISKRRNSMEDETIEFKN